MFQATACIVTDLTLVFLQHTRTAEAHVICSSLLLSWCFSFCDIFRSGFLAMSLRSQKSSWISWDFTNTRHCTRIHLHKSPGAYSNILTCSPKKGLRTHRIEHDTMFRQESSKSSFLPSVCGSNWPKKDRCLLLKEWEKENIRIYILHASSAAASASSSASPSLAWGFYNGTEPREGCAKKSVKIIILHNFCQHLQPLFLNLSSTTNHDMGSTTIILRICVLYTTFSSRTAEAHVICSSLLFSWCFSFCNGFRSGFLAMELTAAISSSASWASCDSTNTQITA